MLRYTQEERQDAEKRLIRSHAPEGHHAELCVDTPDPCQGCAFIESSHCGKDRPCCPGDRPDQCQVIFVSDTPAPQAPTKADEVQAEIEAMTPAVFSRDMIARCSLDPLEVEVFRTTGKRHVIRDEAEGLAVVLYTIGDRVMLDRILASSCETCPFKDGCNDEATIAQNYGCLPTKHDILKYKDQHARNWMCHSDETKVCRGLARERDVTTGTTLLYSKWCHEGDIPDKP